jgi:hypothetical protein
MPNIIEIQKEEKRFGWQGIGERQKEQPRFYPGAWSPR